MKKLFYLIILTMLFSSCTLVFSLLNPYKAYQKDFDNNFINEEITSSTLASLFDYKETPWDEVVYYGSYSFSPENIERDLGITNPFIPSSYNDGDWLLVFVDKHGGDYSLKYLIVGNGYQVDLSEYIPDNPHKTHFLKDDLYERAPNSRKILLKKKGTRN